MIPLSALEARLAPILDRCVIDDPLTTKYYLFTGVGVRSSTFHLGHHCLLRILAALSREGIPLLYQIANDEKKFLTPPPKTDGDMLQLTAPLRQMLSRHQWGSQFTLVDNILDRQLLRPLAQKINSTIPIKKLVDLFGEELDAHRAGYVGYQLAPMVLRHLMYPDHTPVVITAADQLPFFLTMRDLAHRVGIPKPQIILIHPLKDMMMMDKMSSTHPGKMIPLSDVSKIKKAISGTSKATDFCDHLIQYLAMSDEDSRCLSDHKYTSDKKDAIIAALTREAAVPHRSDLPPLSHELALTLGKEYGSKVDSMIRYAPLP